MPAAKKANTEHKREGFTSQTRGKKTPGQQQTTPPPINEQTLVKQNRKKGLGRKPQISMGRGSSKNIRTYTARCVIPM